MTRAPETRPTVAVIGPVSPPTHGHMVFTERILDSDRLNREFRIVHVDASDHRELDTLAKVDLTNVLLAVRHAARLVRTLIADRPRVVYVPLAQNKLGLGRDLVFIALALIGRAKVLSHVHGGGFGSFIASSPAWFRIPALALLRRSAALVVMSEWQRERVRLGMPGARLFVVPHGTEPATEAERPDEGPLRVIYASSSLQEGKGTLTALAAASAAQRRGVSRSWDFVGPWLSDEERRRGEAIVAGVDGIRFHGALDRTDLMRSYESADVFVFPTQELEGFAMVRIEAMAAGLPVITTAAGGAAEIVRDGVDGFIVDYDRPEEIVSRLDELHTDPERRIEMGRHARERQLERFSVGSFESALAAVWRQVAEGDGAMPR